ncbi:lysophospholipid acyltransferase 5-like [Acanthaster planci]|uniref:Lysophospholipid acyltransferase 5 n=1 Tax=Acanthaster planci TaxID=133434 RepID=A0A8B7ZET2_ACAPL|nr:lysophospholipid acyltransferase 5-like [Acanthaster planci]
MPSETVGTEANPGTLSAVAGLIGLDAPSFLFLLTLLSCYPLCYVSRTYLHGQAQTIKHVYFTLCGLTLASLNFGYDIVHSMISLLVNYILLVTVGGSQFSVALSFAFNMGYLLIAYIVVSTDGYDVNWTTPHCILTLRMIGTAFDLYDGHRDESKLSAEQKELNIKTTPTLLEMCGHTYFPGGFFAGPQFPMRRYLDFTAEKLLDNDEGRLPDCVMPAFNRLGAAALYALLECVLAPIYSNEFLLSEEFAEGACIMSGLAYNGKDEKGNAVWDACASVKPWKLETSTHTAEYIRSFNLTTNTWVSRLEIVLGSVIFFAMDVAREGACIMSGLAYNGKDEKGNAVWDACASVKPWKLETSTHTAEYIRSFNLTTNTWVSRYVFKRLKFLNNRYISQTAAVMFLAVWHGMYIGYYICFGLEIFVTTTEAFVQDAVKRYPPLAKLVNNPALKFPIFAYLKFNVSLFVGYPLVSFVLLRWRRIRLVYSAVYHIPTLVVVGFPFLYQFAILPRLKKLERAAKKAAEEPQDVQNGETDKSK